MIISCPACATRYAVPDSAVGVDGRVVRCAKCRHSWFQDGPELAEQPDIATIKAAASSLSAPTVQATPAPAPSATVTASVMVPEPVAPPLPPAPPPLSEAAPQFAAPAPVVDDYADTTSSFAHEPPFRPRRNPATLWMTAAILFALVAFAAIGAVARFGLPDWLPLPRSTFAEAEPDLVLDFPHNRQERRPLPNGSDFFNVSGTILNVGKERRAVPTLLIVLRNAHNHVVYSLEAAPPKTVLAPGESETINQAIIDAPKAARAAEIGWKPH